MFKTYFFRIVQAEHVVEQFIKFAVPSPIRENLLQDLQRLEELSASVAANLKTGAAALSMPVGLLRRSGQLLASLAGLGSQTLVSAAGILNERANAIATRVKGFVDKSIDEQIDEVNERPLHVDLAQLSSSIKRVFKVPFLSPKLKYHFLK